MAYVSSISFVFCTLRQCFQGTIRKDSKVSFLVIANLESLTVYVSFVFVFPMIMLCIFSTLKLIYCFSPCNLMS